MHECTGAYLKTMTTHASSIDLVYTPDKLHKWSGPSISCARFTRHGLQGVARPRSGDLPRFVRPRRNLKNDCVFRDGKYR